MTLLERGIAEISGQLLLFLGLIVNEPYDKICVILLCGVWFYTTQYVPPRASLDDYFLATLSFYRVCDGIDYIIIRDAQSKLRYKNQSRPATEFSLFQRAKWALTLLSSPRGIGWEHVYANTIPRHVPIKSRSFFVFRTLLDIIIHAIIFTVTTTQIPRNPAFVRGGPRLTELPWTWRFHGIFICTALPYCVLQLHYSCFCLLVVACGFFTPDDCPPIFGSIFECFNVRRIWGRTWHQFFRRPFLSIAVLIAHGMLRLKLGTVPFGVIISILTYGTAGAMHYFGAYVVLGGRGGGSMKFFYSQLGATFTEVAVEELVRTCLELKSSSQVAQNDPISPIYISKTVREGPKVEFRPPRRGHKVPLALRLLGYPYVIAWLYYTMPIILDPILNAGVLQEDGIINTALALTMKRPIT